MSYQWLNILDKLFSPLGFALFLVFPQDDHEDGDTQQPEKLQGMFGPS
jgi:hypothetical protein